MLHHAVSKAEDRIGRAVTIKWCPIVCREYAVLDASADATCFADFGSKAKPHDDAALAKLSSLLSRGEQPRRVASVGQMVVVAAEQVHFTAFDRAQD